MATGKIKTLFSDKEKTEALFPRTKISAVSDANGVGLDAILENFATESFVANKIAEAQLSGGEGSGNIDLSGYATKDELAAIDFPVDSVNGKTGNVQLSATDVGARPSTWLPTASDVGALPITGGNITGNLKVGNKVSIWADTEGGNIRVIPPDGKVTDYWEMDAHDGGFRIYAYKNATHPNGAGNVFPLTLNTDGSISVGNTAKTRERLGVVPGAESTSYPSCYYRTVDGVTEWINPPMIFGTEYRTVERCNGKVVYAIRVNCGTLPNTSSKSVTTTIPLTATIVSTVGIVTKTDGLSHLMPTISASGAVQCAFFVTAGRHININTFIDMSAYTGYITVKYTKD